MQSLILRTARDQTITPIIEAFIKCIPQGGEEELVIPLKKGIRGEGGKVN